MRYVSTRDQADPHGFEGVLLEGLARDGGLYVPEAWPTWTPDDFRALRGLSYAAIARRVMTPFVAGSVDEDALGRIVCEAYGEFRHRAVAPLVQLGENRWLMELFHGPTLAFKDVAMQVLARLYDHALAKRGGRLTVVGATSGDTGSAAIEAFRHADRCDIFIMHPHGRTSEVQRRQMTTVDSPNVHNLAIDGTFDDCQDLLKAMFTDASFRDAVSLSGVNSINWARVLPQVVYYVASAVALGAPDREVAFCVPTGNFGDVYAGYVAKRMGLPVSRFVVASNSNDILTRALASGDHTLGGVEPTMSPSMDIQVSSNFERLLYDAYGRDGGAIRGLMRQLKSDRGFTIDKGPLDAIRRDFVGCRVDETQTLDTLAETFRATEMLVDPHTAVGLHAAEQARAAGEVDPATPLVTLATAHPAKFPDAVEKASTHRPALPEHLADLYDREERYDRLPAELDTVMAYIRDRTHAAAGV